MLFFLLTYFIEHVFALGYVFSPGLCAPVKNCESAHIWEFVHGLDGAGLGFESRIIACASTHHTRRLSAEVPGELAGRVFDAIIIIRHRLLAANCIHSIRLYINPLRIIQVAIGINQIVHTHRFVHPDLVPRQLKTQLCLPICANLAHNFIPLCINPINR